MESNLVGPGGQPLEDKPSPDEIAKVQAEVETMTKDPAMESYGSALVAGYRLNAWGHHHIAVLEKYSAEARQVYYNTVMMGLVNHMTGQPRPFNEESLVKHLSELLPKVVVEVQARAKAAAEKQDPEPPAKQDSPAAEPVVESKEEPNE